MYVLCIFYYFNPSMIAFLCRATPTPDKYIDSDSASARLTFKTLFRINKLKVWPGGSEDHIKVTFSPSAF